MSRYSMADHRLFGLSRAVHYSDEGGLYRNVVYTLTLPFGILTFDVPRNKYGFRYAFNWSGGIDGDYHDSEGMWKEWWRRSGKPLWIAYKPNADAIEIDGEVGLWDCTYEYFKNEKQAKEWVGDMEGWTIGEVDLSHV